MEEDGILAGAAIVNKRCLSELGDIHQVPQAEITNI